MSLYTYEVFETVAEKMSFIKAATELNLTPSAVSHAISALEEEFGFSLFIRSRSGVTITDNGKRMLPLVRAMRRCNESIEEEKNRINDLNVGKVRISVFHSVSVLWMPEILSRLSAKYPGVEVEINNASYTETKKLIMENEIDLAIITDLIAEDMDFTFLMKDPLMYVVPKGYFPDKKKSVTVSDIKKNRLIMQKECELETRKFMDENDIKVDQYLYTDDDNITMEMTAKGLGMSIIPKLATGIGTADVSVYPIRPQVSRNVGIIVTNPQFISPAARLMKKEIELFVSEL